MNTTPSATHAQNFIQNTNSLKFIAVFLLGIFLLYAIQHHWITEGFIYLMSLVFEQFSIRVASIASDITVLIVAILVLFGLWFLATRFTMLLIAGLICLALSVYFMNNENNLSPLKFKDDSKQERVLPRLGD